MKLSELEILAEDICHRFEVYAPPVPVELMLKQPPLNMWDRVDVSRLSGSFLDIRERFSPRMSLARLLVRHIAASDWGKEQGLDTLLGDTDMLNAFARMLLMPQEMINGLTRSQHDPQTMSLYFEVPASDARDRLLDLS